MASTLSIRLTFISQTCTKFPIHPASSSYSTHFQPPRFSKRLAPPLSLSNNRHEKSTVIKASGTKEQKLVHEGLITESLPNGMFRVKLENGDVILGHISGRIRKSFIRILPGDKVKIEKEKHAYENSAKNNSQLAVEDPSLHDAKRKVVKCWPGSLDS